MVLLLLLLFPKYNIGAPFGRNCLAVCLAALLSAGCDGFQASGLRGLDLTKLRGATSTSASAARRRACAIPSSLTTTSLWRYSKDLSRLNDVVAGASRMLFNLVAPAQATGGRTTTAVRIEARPGGVPTAGVADFDVGDTLNFLHKHGINPEGWGQSGAKSVRDLTLEVRQGESVLRDGKRMIFVVKVIIKDGDYELVEARQVCMRNGSVSPPPHHGMHPLTACACPCVLPSVCPSLILQ